MTPQQFQNSPYREKLEIFLKTPEGQNAINTLITTSPAFPSSEIPHLFAKQVGQREGFEFCIKALMALSTLPKIKNEVEATYGVPDAKK